MTILLAGLIRKKDTQSDVAAFSLLEVSDFFAAYS